MFGYGHQYPRPEVDDPVVWAGHDPWAWMAAGLGSILTGFLVAAAITAWGQTAALAAVVAVILLGLVGLRHVVRQQLQ